MPLCSTILPGIHLPCNPWRKVNNSSLFDHATFMKRAGAMTWSDRSLYEASICKFTFAETVGDYYCVMETVQTMLMGITETMR